MTDAQVAEANRLLAEGARTVDWAAEARRIIERAAELAADAPE